MKIQLLLIALVALAGALFAVGEYCSSDYDCGYDEYCEYGRCISYSDDYAGYSSSGGCCCGGIILPLAAIGLFMGYKMLKK